MDWQVCVMKTVAYRVRTNKQTDRQTDKKKVKTEGPKIMYLKYPLSSYCGRSLAVKLLFVFDEFVDLWVYVDHMYRSSQASITSQMVSICLFMKKVLYFNVINPREFFFFLGIT